MNYETALENKKFVPNTVILFKGVYWAVRQPDSGLTVAANRLAVEQIAINPTKVDPASASTTINTYNFKLTDLNQTVTALFNGVTNFFVGEAVEIWIGRVGVNMAFPDDYLKLPTTYVKNVTKDRNAYNFATAEAKDRLNRSAFGQKNKLEVDITDATTIIDAAAPIDIAVWPAAGLFKLENEFISYASIDVVNNRFNGCIRGEKNSVPAAAKAGATIFLVTEVVANPVDILLQCLISNGGGGVYDVLIDGAGIDEALINVERFEQIRDEFFLGQEYTLLLYGITNINQYLETEIFYANELRLVTDSTAKISLAILNRRVFDDKIITIDDNSIKKEPDYTANDTAVKNVVEIEYDFSEGTGQYRKLVSVEDADSITLFGRREPIRMQLKGIQELDDGAAIATDIAQRFLFRFSTPRPEITFTAHLDKSLVQLGDKTELSSSQIPNTVDGTLNFIETVEVVERGINWKTGDVRFKVGFTSFTGIRECYLAPSDRIITINSQKEIIAGAGRGSLYTTGWKMRLYSDTTREYVSTQVNEIDLIVGDVILFKDDWADTLTTSMRIMFCDYDDAVGTQKRYCFISDNGANFDDTRKTYQITL